MRSFVFFALVFATACSPGFTPFREIEESRIIGAEVRVDSEPTRATPAAGEAATVELVVADPGPRQGRTYALVVCRPGESQLDVVLCDDPTRVVAFALVDTLPGPADPKPNPRLQFVVPDAATLGDAEELWLQGAVCNGGVVRNLLDDPPEYGEAYDPCLADPLADPQPVGQLITSRIKLEVDDNSRNTYPDILSLTFDGVDFTSTAPADAPVVGCAGMGYVEIPADDTAHTIAVTSSPSSRESYVPEALTDPVDEVLALFLFRTAGETDVAFGVIDDDSAVAELGYIPPPAAEVDASGTLVRLWVQFGDERNAYTFLERAVCVTRP